MSGPWLIPAGRVSAGAAPPAAYQIARSLRSRSAGAYLSRTFSSAGDRTKWTYSGCVKRSALGVTQMLFNGGAVVSDTGWMGLLFHTDDTLRLSSASNIFLGTTAVFRDVGAHYHIVVAIDGNNATPNNRARMYVNGVEITSFASRTNLAAATPYGINQAAAHMIGEQSAAVSLPGSFISGYISDVHFIDGQQLDASSFGQFDATTGAWVPKAFSGGAYGTNGFHLDLADNSAATAAALGKDSSGNGNNWTPNSFSVTAGVTNDSMVDTPTNYGTDTGIGGEVRGNYCTLNPLDKDRNHGTLSNGALDYECVYSDNYAPIRGTMAIPADKVGYEVTNYSAAGTHGFYFGCTKDTADLTGRGVQLATVTLVGGFFSSDLSVQRLSDISGAGSVIGGASWSVGDTIQFLIDAPAGKYWFGKGGNYYNAAGTLTAFNAASPTGTFTPGATYLPYAEVFASGDNSNRSGVRMNFGQRAFANALPSGFKALCTQNLADPAIVKPSQYFDINLRVGTAAAFNVTGKGFQPDLTWIKGRSGATDHALYDSVRGVQKDLASNTTGVETTEAQGVLAFNADGFSGGSLAKINTIAAATYVDWLWRAGGAAVANSNGTIASTVSANPTAGFSVVSYTGNASAGQTVGHGLGVAPKLIIARPRATANWPVWHIGLPSTSYYVQLNATAGQNNIANYWGVAPPSSTVFGVGPAAYDTNIVGSIIAYCFAEVPGFSRIGSYIGNGAADGPFIWCGFRPRWIMVKRVDGVGEWVIIDASRSPLNPASGADLEADRNLAELARTSDRDILSNGFKTRGVDSFVNASGGTYIYAAFAENPFKYARAR